MDRLPDAPGWRERLSYRFDRFMERGTVALIVGLFVVSVALIVGITVIVVAAGGDDQNLGLPTLLWMSLLRTLDSGTMGGDTGSATFMAGMLAVTFGGIFVISTLIGILNNGLSDKLADLRKGRSRVLERDHVLILGWSQQVFPVISQLIEAGVGRRQTVIVVMADQDRVEMEDAIRERVTLSRRVRVVCRSGRPTSLSDLRIANPDEARAIIVLQSEGEDPDVDVLKTILALTGRNDRRKESYRIVAEVKDHASVDIAKLIAGDEVHLLLADDLISRIIAQTCRQSGLSAIYGEILDFSGNELHVVQVADAFGKTFGEVVATMAGGIPAGIVRNGAAQLCPSPGTRIEAGDALVVLAEDHGLAHLAGPEQAESQAIVAPTERKPAPERTLILGWNRRAELLVRELDGYVAPGSTLVAVSPLQRLQDEAAGLTSLHNLDLQVRVESTTDRAVLDSLDIPSFDHVIVLCEADDRDPEMADARTLLALLHLRDIGQQAGSRFSIVSEMLDERNRELAEVSRADDFVVSSRVLSLLLAQIAETPELDDVFRDLFDADGAEIYLRDAADYVTPGTDVSFATLQAAAQQRGEVALGWRSASSAQDAGAAYGVVLNPGRDARRAFAAGDRVVVLAES